MYRGDGDGGFVTGSAEPIGSGWGSLSAPDADLGPAARRRRRRPAAPRRRRPSRTAASGCGPGSRCTPPGGRLKVNVQ